MINLNINYDIIIICYNIYKELENNYLSISKIEDIHIFFPDIITNKLQYNKNYLI